MRGKVAIILVAVLFLAERVSGLTCVPNCLKCFGPGTSECLKCQTPKKLENFACVDSCSATYLYDTYDNTCKKSRYMFEYACPEGSYNPATKRQTTSDCLDCQAGYACPGLAFKGPVIACKAGYYCLAKAYLEFDDNTALQDKTKICPAGSYCPAASTTAITCPAGKYCDSERLATPTGDCAAGYLCTGGSTTPRPVAIAEGDLCPAGKYCIAGTSDATPCPMGTYLPNKGGAQLSDCLTCPPGKYCGLTGATTWQGSCQAGFYCPAGTTTAAPAANYCPAGFYCPGGTGEPLPCDPDKLQDSPMGTSCIACPAGYYCEENKIKKQCPAGSYCPGNNLVVNCPPGKFRSDPGANDVSQCLDCTTGNACETPGVATPTTACAPGYYCTLGTATRFPTNDATEKGNKCAAGYYCPEGSGAARDCPAGQYCALAGLSAVSGACQEGYYCPLRSITGMASVCSAGYFCPAASGSASPCPKGQYGPLQGAAAVGDCVACDQGKYCPTPGLATPNADACVAGFYCPLSQAVNNPQSTICPRGHRCPAGSVAAEPCPPGSYQPLRGEATCLACPAGKFCEGQGNLAAADCPRGYYCLTSTTSAYQYPCPSGKYYDKIAATASTLCISCPKGFYCPMPGLSTYSDVCVDGFICLLGSAVPNPTDNVVGYSCPKGYYCPAGYQSNVACPAGTFNEGLKAIAQSDCQPIIPGRFSTVVGATAAILATKFGTGEYNNCNAGYACFGGSYTSTPTSSTIGKACDKGKYCPAGSAFEILCPVGQYNKLLAQGTCLPCPAGSYCYDTGTQTETLCTSKNYCESGAKFPIPCPPGTFSTQTGLSATSQCAKCPGGKYCELPATDSVGTCAAGYVCNEGSADQMPCLADYNSGVNTFGRCPLGQFCAAGTAVPTQCGIGTYQDTSGNAACKQCPYGYGCTSNGISTLTPAMYCTAGYVCISGSATLAPTDGTKGKECPIGYYCPTGTPVEIRCGDGTNQPLAAQPTCTPCVAGKGCYYKKNDPAITVIDCPAYYYCPAGSSFVGKICEKGTTSTSMITGLKQAIDCMSCLKSKYCVDAEKDSTAADVCAAGYFCNSGATSPTPVGEPHATLCSPGFYCGVGSLSETPCPTGKFRQDAGGMSADECSICLPGQYCTRGKPVPDPCPAGKYCPLGTDIPKLCPAATYFATTGAKEKYECTSCPAGYYCKAEGLTTYTTSPCPASSYCLERALAPISCLAGFYIPSAGSSIAACNACSANYYCEAGTPTETSCGDSVECPQRSPGPVPCEGGYYCQNAGSTITPNLVKKVCPSNYYCPVGSKDKINCTDDHICPEKSIRPVSCPYGSFIKSNLNRTALKNIDDACYFCERGYYAGETTCLPCPAGYICLGKTIAKYPVNVTTDNGYECPPGYYCPEKSLIEQPCPIASYRNTKKGKSLADCYVCPENTFSDKIGQPSCKKCGPSAVSPRNSTTCTCLGSKREFFKSDSSCRCISGFYQVKYGITGKQDDSILDCEPHVYDTCPTGQIYNYEGKCVAKENCATQCRGSGKYSDKFGVCICDSLDKIDVLCDKSCREAASKVIVTASNITVTNPKNTSETLVLSFKDVEGIFTDGIDLTNLSSSTVKSIDLSPIGFVGTYGPAAGLQTAFASYLKSGSTKRLLATTGAVPSPSLCTKPGEPVAFGVSKDHYPVYLKDSLVNTVKNFDYGAFVALADRLTKTSVTTNVFLFKFTQNGTYLFGDSSFPDMQMVVKVSDSCGDTYVVPMTTDNLNALGVAMRDDIVKGYELWIYMTIVAVILVAFLGSLVLIRFLGEWILSWTYGQDVVTVADKKKAGEPDEEDEDAMAQIVNRSDETVDGLFFVYLKQKLTEVDDKMHELLAKANISSVKKLRKLADKIVRLKEIFGQHVNALIMPNGMTIAEYIKANEDQLAKDSSDYSSVIDESDERSGSGTPREHKKKKKQSEKEVGAPAVETKPEEKEAGAILVKDEGKNIDRDVEKEIEKDTQKAKAEEQVLQANLKGDVQKRKEEYLAMVLRHSAGGNAKDVQDYAKEESERLSELQGKLAEELENQNAGLQEKLQRRQERKQAALAELEKVRKAKEETDLRKRLDLEKLNADRKNDLELVQKETEDEHERGKQLIDKALSEQMAEHHAQFIRQFNETTNKDELLSRHEGETRRLKEHLESEKRRQERELEMKIEERLTAKKKDLLANYKKQEDTINDNYRALDNEHEARRALIEASGDAVDDRLTSLAEQLEAERKRVEKQVERHGQSEDIVFEAKKRGEGEAIEKEFQLEERKVYLDSRQESDEFIKRQVDQEKALKDKFTRDVKNAPTSKEKNEILAQYDQAKKALKDGLEAEKRKMDDRTEERLAERRRARELKKIQLESKLEMEKLEADKKLAEKTQEDSGRQTDEVIEQLLTKALAEQKQSVMEIPAVFECLVRKKRQDNLAALRKTQFAELSKQLASMQAQLMKEKFLEITAVKEATFRKVKEVEKRAMAPEKYQRKVEQIQKDEVAKIEALNVNYENKAIAHESQIRTALANQHHDEQGRLITTEETGRGRLFDRVLRRYNVNNDIPPTLIEELNRKSAQEHEELREEAKAQRDKKLQEAQKLLGDLNQEELQEMERKIAGEIDAEAKKLEQRLLEKKKKAFEERRKQHEERLAKIPAISIEQRKTLLEEYQRDLSRLEQAMTDERENQLKKMRDKLIQKKILKERMESHAAKKARQKLEEASNEPLIAIEGVKEEPARPATRQKQEKTSSYNYKPLLMQWTQKMTEKRGPDTRPMMDRERSSLLVSTNEKSGPEKSLEEETKVEERPGDQEGAYVNMKELFETVLNCYDLANTVQDFEFPEIAKAIEKLTYFLEAITKGGKRLGDAGASRLGAKMTAPDS